MNILRRRTADMMNALAGLQRSYPKNLGLYQEDLGQRSRKINSMWDELLQGDEISLPVGEMEGLTL